MKQSTVDAIRSFNRTYTGMIGLLDKYILDSPYSLPEARVLYEIYHREGILAGEIVALLSIDKGYLSRILDQFSRKKLVAKSRSASDGRSVHLSLTAKGRAAFEVLNQASEGQVREIFSRLPLKDQGELVYHMDEIKKILSTNDGAGGGAPGGGDGLMSRITIRTELRPGDLGMIIHLHG